MRCAAGPRTSDKGVTLNVHEQFPGGPAEWAALYAVGALASEERRDFEIHLATGCPACTTELAQLSPVVAALADALPPTPPDPQTRAALLKRIGTPASPSPSPLRRHLDLEMPPASPELFLSRAVDAAWEKSDVPGVSLRVLHVDRASNQFTALV